jgi:repressor LexA
MSERPLTPRQSEILQLIRDSVAATGLPPTRAEICQAFGFASPNAAEEHLRALARKGAIELTDGIARGIRLAEPPGLPLIGRVAAGRPILAEQHIQGRYQVDASLFKPHADYLLKVRGASMRTPASTMATCSPCIAPRKSAAARSSWPACRTK